MFKINYLTTLALLLAMGAVAQSSSKAPSLVASGATPEKVAEGLRFGEGPAADAEGNVYFTDIPNMLVKKWHLDGTVTTVREDSGRANGLMFGKDGNLYACEMGARRVSKQRLDGTVTTVAERCDGKRFNQPNDLWLDGHGGIYFTDPIYGQVEGKEMDGRHVYYIAADGEVTRAAEGLENPNGIVGTPNGKTLYVADQGGNSTYAFDIGRDGELSNRRKLIDRGSDGMVLDAKGNLYLTGGENVAIYSPEGSLLENIATPEGTTNVTFGGKDRKTLFITCPSSVYAIPMTVRGAKAAWE